MLLQISKKYKLGRSNAQSAIEYAVVVACVVAALLAMQLYLKRGTQGRLRQASDEIGGQYSSTSTSSTIKTELDSNVIIKQSMVPLKDSSGNPLKDTVSGFPINGIQSDVKIDHETTSKSGTESLGAFEND